MLTFDIENDSFADRRWNTIRCNAQIRSHVSSTNFGQVQDITVLLFDCKTMHKQQK